ncbi:fumarylacetoacetate hydrolase family protein [Telluria beijingensis]|uniref:fumarylacetoacetate hydrolase family protein n=1 Tax=Telluria beijingensis TaxID=3068633 RepID=UPI002795FCDF|nr:fumarylacetoacetate hydrolase family protein [Massilia sp. REN29]
MHFRRTVLHCASLALVALTTLPASAATPAGATLAPIAQAHTFAQVRQGDQVHTLLALKMTPGAGTLTAIDLSAASGSYSPDAFDVIARFDAAALDALASQGQDARAYPIERLLGVGPRGLAHIAAGTNYPAHGEEVGMHEAFLFPKLSQAGGPRTTVAASPGALLDYEVEVCARFDRELRSTADFDAARKGFFLCGDFSDRATLVRNIDLAHPASGDGFADAKSGPDRFPTGALLVVPRDWKAFLQGVTIATHVDGQQRQQARAGDMIKDLRAIVSETLDEAGKRTWSYAGGRIPMVARAAIGTGSAVLTGTGDGVVFREPEPAVIEAVTRAKDRAAQLAQIERYLAGEAAKRIYLQPGNRVRHSSNVLGWIDTTVVPKQ